MITLCLKVKGFSELLLLRRQVFILISTSLMHAFLLSDSLFEIINTIETIKLKQFNLE